MFAIPRLHAQPLIIKQPAGQAVPLGGNAAFSIEVTGRGPFRYQWLFNGTNLPNDLITSVAGNGPAAPYNGAYSGDGGPATNASLFYPQGVGFDGDGNLYIADNNNNRVRRVDTNGIISTIAGNGLGTYRGDGGEATNASLYRPNNVTFDSAGNLYIADISIIAFAGWTQTASLPRQPVTECKAIRAMEEPRRMPAFIIRRTWILTPPGTCISPK